MTFELRCAEFRVALRRIVERYPPDTIAGRLAADVLAKYPTGFENADRENDDEPFDIPEIEGLPHGPEAAAIISKLVEALLWIVGNSDLTGEVNRCAREALSLVTSPLDGEGR